MPREVFSVGYEVFWLLAIGYWLLAIGYWLLAIGYWLLAIGYWVEFTNRTKLYSTTNAEYLMDAL